MEITNIILEILSQYDEKYAKQNSDIILEEIEMDSMLLVQLIVEIEDKLGFEFDDNDLDLTLYKSIGNLVEKIQTYVNKEV